MKIDNYFSSLHALNEKRKTRRKINRFLNTGQLAKSDFRLSEDQIKRNQEFCNDTLRGLGIDKWHTAYAKANGIISPNYIPEDFFYVHFEPTVNYYDLSLAYCDKFILDKFFIGVKKPFIHVASIGGYFYDEQRKTITLEQAISVVKELIIKEGKLIYKPSLTSGGGRNLVVLTHDSIPSLPNLLNENDFVVQRYIYQNDVLASLNPTSLNTVRVMTYRPVGSTDTLHLSSIVRMGRKGMVVDNQSSGGISAGVKEDGQVKNAAFDEGFNRFDNHHPDDETIVYGSKQIPRYKEIVALCKRMHEEMPYFPLISWDIAIDNNDDLILVELNTRSQEINFHQLNNGPLFGDNTTTVLESFFQYYEKFKNVKNYRYILMYLQKSFYWKINRKYKQRPTKI